MLHRYVTAFRAHVKGVVYCAIYVSVCCGYALVTYFLRYFSVFFCFSVFHTFNFILDFFIGFYFNEYYFFMILILTPIFYI